MREVHQMASGGEVATVCPVVRGPLFGGNGRGIGEAAQQLFWPALWVGTGAG